MGSRPEPFERDRRRRVDRERNERDDTPVRTAKPNPDEVGTGGVRDRRRFELNSFQPVESVGIYDGIVRSGVECT